MTYYVKALCAGYKLGDFSITGGETKIIEKDLYNYLVTTFGDSGMFTFKTENKSKQVVESTEEATKPKRQPRKKVSKQEDK